MKCKTLKLGPYHIFKGAKLCVKKIYIYIFTYHFWSINLHNSRISPVCVRSELLFLKNCGFGWWVEIKMRFVIVRIIFLICLYNLTNQGGEAHLRWVAPAPSVGCSRHYISEIKLKSGKRTTLRHNMVNLLPFLLHKLFLVYMSKYWEKRFPDFLVHIHKMKRQDFLPPNLSESCSNWVLVGNFWF